MNKVIKTQEDYQQALDRLEQLMDRGVEPDSPEAAELELLRLILKDYETKKFDIPLPDPVSAILFRMDQQDLKPRDLIPYIGSRSKVSEVLSRKRPLTLTMMRALQKGLDIPEKVLLKEYDKDFSQEDLNWLNFPIREMSKRGWMKKTSGKNQEAIIDAVKAFFKPIGTPFNLIALNKNTDYVRAARSMDRYSLIAWYARVISIAQQIQTSTTFKDGTIDMDFMRDLVQLSIDEKGPQKAREFLKKNGIVLVIEPHLPQTHLDGAAIMTFQERPIIGLTLRHDRIDNFWFCLMHEIAHLALHFGQGINLFFDDLDMENPIDAREKDADNLAKEALIPKEEWLKSPAKSLRSPEAAESLARKLNIHPAIVAGRMRYEFHSYRILNQLVGRGEVRKLFSQIQWE